MLRVSTLELGLLSNRLLLSAVDISKPVIICTSARVGEAGPWPNTKALRVSDQKYEAAISSDSFLSISAMDSLMHWSNFRSPHWNSFELPILRNQSFHPLVGLGQERKASFHSSKEKFSALKGILCLCVYQIGGIWVSQWTKALEVRLIGRNHDLIGQLLKGLEDEGTKRIQRKEKKGKKGTQ